MPKPTIRSMFLLAAALALAGCVSLAQGAPEKQRFAWAASRPSGEPAREGGPILLVAPATTAPGFGQRAFVVRLTDTRFEQDFYHEMFVPPAEAVAELARTWLARSGTFTAVVTTGSTLAPTHRLELEVRSLHADVRAKDEPAAVLELAWFLVAVPGQLVGQGVANARHRAQDASGAQLALAFDRALASALAQLEQGVRALADAPRAAR